MLQSSFIMLPGVRASTEIKIWEQGIYNWDDFLDAKTVAGIGQKRKLYYDRLLMRAKTALHNLDYSYFCPLLPPNALWRMWKECEHHCLYLDIEIAARGDITMMGLYDGMATTVLVKGKNLDKAHLLRIIQSKSMIVTFNGSSFDIPVLEKYFGTSINILHIDLKHMCQTLGLQGGLKVVEREIGIFRPAHLYGSPIDAWRAYHASGDEEYLQLLIEYNKFDCVNLLPLLEYCYRAMCAKVFKAVL